MQVRAGQQAWGCCEPSSPWVSAPSTGQCGRRPCGGSGCEKARSALPGGELDVLGVVVGAEVQDRINQLDPLHLQHFHI